MTRCLLTAILSILLASCAATNPGVIRGLDADYYYTDWRTLPSQKAFDVAAAPRGGMAAFIAKLHYPLELRRRGVRGEVTVLVSLDSSGRVLDAKVVRSVDPVLDQILLDAVYHTQWTPALKNGVPIPLKFYLPEKFT